MNARGLSRSLTALFGAGFAWSRALAYDSSDGDNHSYAGPKTETHFLLMVTIENAAMLDATGKPYDPPVEGAGVRFHSTLYNLLARTYIEKGRKISFKTDAVSEGKYRQAIQQFPNFPFGYYALALTLRDRRDPGWREYAQRAVAVFERTTAMANCNEGHFAALKELRGYLAEGAL